MARMLDLKQLQCFVAVAEEGSFSRAAQSLNMTQPPLSRQVSNLEAFLGVELLRRTTRTVRLSQAGREFLPDAQRLLRLTEHVTLQGSRLSGATVGKVRLGFTAAASYSFLPQLIGRSQKVYPGLDLVLRDMPTQSQLEALFSGQIDVGFLRTPTCPPGLVMERVIREPFVLAIPDSHPLLRKRAIQLADLSGNPLIMYSPLWDPLFHSLLTALFQNSGLNPNIVQHVTQVHSVLALVQAGIGIGLVPQSAANLRYPDVEYRHMAVDSRQYIDLHMAWRAEQDLPVLTTFMDFARQFAAEWQPPSIGPTAGRSED